MEKKLPESLQKLIKKVEEAFPGGSQDGAVVYKLFYQYSGYYGEAA